TASGEPYDESDMTAAHPSLPFGSRLCVTNLFNGRSTTVRVNDRGPFVGGRIIDLSLAAARELGMLRAGTARVRVKTCEEDNCNAGALTRRYESPKAAYKRPSS